MRFPKTLTACCLLAGVTATVTIAQDSDSQQKALDALRQFTAEKEGRSSKGLTTAPSSKADEAAAKELEEKARQSVSQTEPAPAVAQTPDEESEADRKAREALDDLRRADPTPQGNTSTVVIVDDSDNKEEALRKALDAQYTSAPADNTISPDLERQARQQLDSMTTKPAMAASQSVVMTKPKPKTQKEKLNDLLELYMDNTITPREYHDQRAIIIAGN